MLGALTALASVAFIIEGLFPPLFLPGAKMGVSNIFSVLAVVMLSPAEAVILVAVRTTIGALISGGLSAWIYSFSAGVASVAVTALLYTLFCGKISLVATSVCAAVVHNAVQNTVFCIVTQTPQMFAYLPYLALLGVVAGLVVGVACVLLLKASPIKRLMASVSQKDGQTH